MAVQRLVYLVDGGTAEPAKQISLPEAGLRERQDLQEWVIAHPEVLGDDVLIITSEYDQWSSVAGTTAKERLDILGLDSAGRLLVAELKRDSDRRIHIQAITYAALVSSFTEETLAQVHAEFLTRRGHTTSSEQGLALIRDHVEAGLEADVLAEPRIVLIAGDFPPQVVTTSLWLNRRGIDITLQQVSAWDVGGSVAVTFDQVFPVAGVDDLLLSPALVSPSAAKEKVGEQKRAASATSVIVEKGLLADGATLELKPTVEVPAPARSAVEAWIDGDPNRGRATWISNKSKPLVWAVDGSAWSPTALARHILQEAAAVDRSVRGPAWWVTEDGQDLVALAFGASGRDWTDVHQLITLVEPGEWTAYGDIADIVSVPPITVGNHIANCAECPEGAHRVLTKDGTPSEGFHWSDPSETRTCEEVLGDEGLTFIDGSADPARHVDSTQLKTRLTAQTA